MTDTSAPPTRPDAEDEEVLTAFRRSVDEGEVRLARSWPDLLATGFLGGADVSVGVLALLIVEEATGSRLLGALAFPIGFIALNLARSELFTENFLVPVTAVVARRATVLSLVRLWVGTLIGNLVAAWAVTRLLMVALPRLHPLAVETGAAYPELGIGAQSFALAVVGGAIITLMTWMERQSDTEGAKLLAVVVIAFLLVAGPLNHVIVNTVEMFSALHVGAPFGYADWARTAAWAALGNLVGGLGLVTVLRLVQVGSGEIRAARREPLR